MTRDVKPSNSPKPRVRPSAAGRRTAPIPVAVRVGAAVVVAAWLIAVMVLIFLNRF